MIMMGKRILFVEVFCGAGWTHFFVDLFFIFFFLILKILFAVVLCGGGGSDTVCLVSRNKQRDKWVWNRGQVGLGLSRIKRRNPIDDEEKSN